MKVAIINHCNQWHEYSSFRLIGAVPEDDLEDTLKVIQKETEYSDEEMEDYIDVNIIDTNELDI